MAFRLLRKSSVENLNQITIQSQKNEQTSPRYRSPSPFKEISPSSTPPLMTKKQKRLSAKDQLNPFLSTSGTSTSGRQTPTSSTPGNKTPVQLSFKSIQVEYLPQPFDE